MTLCIDVRSRSARHVRGPLQGGHGILLRKERRHRLLLGVRVIQQAVAVEIDARDVAPA